MSSKHFNGNPCIKCGSTLRYKNDNKCVQCTRNRGKEFRERNPEYMKEWLANNPGYMKEWFTNNPEYIKEWLANNPGYTRQFQRQPEAKRKAYIRYLVRYAIQKEELSHPTELICKTEGCKNQAQQYHHHFGYDLENALNVVPLCIPCHKMEG